MDLLIQVPTETKIDMKQVCDLISPIYIINLQSNNFKTETQPQNQKQLLKFI